VLEGVEPRAEGEREPSHGGKDDTARPCGSTSTMRRMVRGPEGSSRSARGRAGALAP